MGRLFSRLAGGRGVARIDFFQCDPMSAFHFACDFRTQNYVLRVNRTYAKKNVNPKRKGERILFNIQLEGPNIDELMN